MNIDVQRYMLVSWRETLAKQKDCKSCPGIRRPVKWIAKRRTKQLRDPNLKTSQVKTKYLCDMCVKKLSGDWLVTKYE